MEKLDTIENELTDEKNSVGFTGNTHIGSKKDLLLNEERSEKEDFVMNSFLNEEEGLKKDIDTSGFLKSPQKVESELNTFATVDPKPLTEDEDIYVKEEDKKTDEINKEDANNEAGPNKDKLLNSRKRRVVNNKKETNKFEGLVNAIALSLIEECKEKNISVFNLSKEELKPVWEHIINSVKGD